MFWTEGERPAIAGTKSGNLIILGSALTVWSEFEKARQIDPKAELMAINLAFCGLRYWVQRQLLVCHHWISLHPEFFAIRHLYAGKRTTTHCFTNAPDKGVDYVWPVSSEGSSGLFATKVALLMGYEKIMLCGIPIKDAPHFHDMPGFRHPEMEDRAVWLAWEMAADALRGRVKSFSGRTKDLLGEPTEDWINGK